MAKQLVRMWRAHVYIDSNQILLIDTEQQVVQQGQNLLSMTVLFNLAAFYWHCVYFRTVYAEATFDEQY